MSSILMHNFQKTRIQVETRCPVLFDTFLFDKHFSAGNCDFALCCVYTLVLQLSENVDIWYIAVLFFTCVAFFFRSQNISTIGLGQRTKPEGSENPCVRIRPLETSKN